MPEDAVRLQKYLSERGLASRRGAAQLIRGGAVRVDGQPVTEPGERIAPSTCTVTVNGCPVPPARPAARTILLYKPRGTICSRRAGRDRTVYDLLDGEAANLVPVGRLDKNSEGLLLLSNDGALVHRLTHPRYGQSKTYRVTVAGRMSPRVIQQLQSRMVIDGYRIQPVQVAIEKQDPATGRSILRFVLKEGRNRQIRKMCDQAGLTIRRLVRIGIGELSAAGLRPGQWRDVTSAFLPAPARKDPPQ